MRVLFSKRTKKNALGVFVGFDVMTRLSRLKNSARKRNISVDLDVNKYQVLIDNGCHYCGDSLNNENGYCLDRVDNEKGYTITNVVGCCKICNRAKSDMDVFTFAQWLIRAGNHTKKAIEYVENEIKNGRYYDFNDELAIYNEINNNKPKQRIRVKKERQ